MDQIFGRNNFVTTIIWQQRTSRENRKPFSNNHEYILVYAKNKKLFDKTANKLKVTDEILKRYQDLMKINHPDKGGSEWVTKKLNQARETLLG